MAGGNEAKEPGDPGGWAAREGIWKAGGMAGASQLGKDLELQAIVITPGAGK